MFHYIFKRLLWFIPMLFLISASAFVLKVNAPGNPVEHSFGMAPILDGSARQDVQAYEAAYAEKYKDLKLHLPVFYCSLTRADTPRGIHAIPFDMERQATFFWAKKHQNPQAAIALNSYLNEVKSDFYKKEALHREGAFINQLLVSKKEQIFLQALDKDTLLSSSLKTEIKKKSNALFEKGEILLAYLPSFRWHGSDNQYHHWLSEVLKGNWGKSYSDNQAVLGKVKSAFSISFGLGIGSLILTFTLGIGLGFLAVKKQDSFLDKGLTLFAFASFAVPSFLLATLASVFLTTPEYGYYLDWFPTQGIGRPQEEHSSFCFFLGDRISHLALPILCTSYTLFALIQQQTRNLLLKTLQQSDYVKTARAKGLKEYLVLWKHAFRTILLPLITLFTGLLPALLSGLIAIEYIFNLPGLGRLMIESLQIRDWPVALGVLLISSLLVLLAYLLADILYAIADPRISYKQNKV